MRKELEVEIGEEAEETKSGRKRRRMDDEGGVGGWE